jgi:hypothetical protein
MDNRHRHGLLFKPYDFILVCWSWQEHEPPKLLRCQSDAIGPERHLRQCNDTVAIGG